MTTRPSYLPEVAELQALCLVAELGGIGKAAAILHLSQPAVSKKIRLLETRMGCRLFDRSPRGVLLTAAGRKVYPEAKKILAQVETLNRLMLGLSDEVEAVRLAVSPTIAEFVLPGILSRIREQQGHRLSVEIMTGNSHVVCALIREGHADIGIAVSCLGAGDCGDNSMTERSFLDDEVVIAVPSGHPWREHDEIPLDWFLSTPLIMRDLGASSRAMVEHYLAVNELELAPPAMEIGSTGAIIDVAVSTCTPALISRLAMSRHSDQLLVRRVENVRFTRQFVIMLRNEGEHLGSATKALLQAAVGQIGPEAGVLLPN